MIQGRNLIVSINGTPVAAAKSCTLTVSQDFLQVCSPTTSRVFNKIPTTYDWSISVNGLIISSSAPKNLVQSLVNGAEVLLTFEYNGTQLQAGLAFIKSIEQSGSVGNLATFSASFESNGELFRIWAKLTPSALPEGATTSMTYNNGSITYNFTTGSGVSATSTTLLTQGGKIYIWADFVYAVYSGSITSIKTAITNQDSAALNAAMVACGDDSLKIIELPAGVYTILCDIEANTKIFVLAK